MACGDFGQCVNPLCNNIPAHGEKLCAMCKVASNMVKPNGD